MHKINFTSLLVGAVGAFVIVYVMYITSSETTHQEALINAVGGAGGMVLGLVVYQLWLKDDKEE